VWHRCLDAHVLICSFVTARWATEAWYTEEVTLFDGVYEIQFSAMGFGYTLGGFWTKLLNMFLVGLVFRVVSFFLLVGFNRDKQR
jgi:hypothetical protein